VTTRKARRMMTQTGEIGNPPGASVIIGRSPETPSAEALTSTLLLVRDLLKSREGASLILDYRVRQAIFEIETQLGGIRHGT
jgi:hypothetical protein